jgi:hypothetical protein
MVWLLREAGSDPGRRLEAIKTGFTVGLGGGGSIALFLAIRRQWHQEAVAVVTMRDADERRVTEQYIKATEHLGSPLAQVRIAGLYALERLAQTSPEQRPAVADVIASYLRMPFTLPDETDGRASTADLDALQEMHVRRAAGKILTTHLRDPRPEAERRGTPTNPEFWAVTLDLTGATLVDFNARHCVFLGGLRCQSATFAGTARFTGARFAGEARFAGADFRDTARFTDAIFEGDVLFADAGRREAWWFLGAKVTNLEAVLEVPGFHVTEDGSIVADTRTGPDELRSDR